MSGTGALMAAHYGEAQVDEADYKSAVPGYRGAIVNDPVEARRSFPCNSDFHEQFPQAGPVNVRLHD